ncbi:MAG: hypothetical protein JO069_12400, partial [Verrucomicrobia bacterium]|nr:hypothetical protein [Verrucomicrobiota bacterium]
MPLLESLSEIALASHCGDLPRFREITREASEDQRSFVRTILDSRLVDEAEFLHRLAQWLEIPWWNQLITTVSAPLREKV